MLAHLTIYILAFIGIWIGSGLAVRSVEKLSRILKISSFALSFLVLGLFTSLTEVSVGINSIIINDPEIYVGTLIGACIVIFMLIIPLLAISGNKIRISSEFHGFNLPALLAVVSLPVLLAMDGRVGRADALIAIAAFVFLVVAIQTKRGLLEKLKNVDGKSKTKIGKELLRVAFGIVTIFIASRLIVEQTLYFSEQLQISPFLISLLVIAVGTNIPELSIVVRSVFMRSNQVAFGDYVGSATFNTLLFGALTLVYGKPINLTNSYLISLLFLIAGLFMFYYFARSKKTITRAEGLVLLLFYLLFVGTEIFLHKESFLLI